jgi:hypothetical protein
MAAHARIGRQASSPYLESESEFATCRAEMRYHLSPAATSTVDELPGCAPYNPRPYRTLLRYFDLNDPLAGQFIRGIANTLRGTTQIGEIDVEQVHLLSCEGQPHLGGGIPLQE